MEDIRTIKNCNFIIRPIGDSCNFNCSYCNTRTMNVSCESNYKKLDLAHIEVWLDKISKSCLRNVAFTWHGGEPLLLPIEFYEGVIKLQKTYLGNIDYSNIVQTNGYFLDQPYIKFLKENNFHVGISIDGPDKESNIMRFSKAEDFEKVLNNIYMAKDAGMEFSLFIVLHKNNIHKMNDIFNFIKEINPSKGVVLNPLFELDMEDSMISEDEYFNLLKEFHKFLSSNNLEIRNNIISSVKMGFENQLPRLCYFSDRCHNFISMNSSGNMYSTCLEDDNYYLGNILNDSMDKILEINGKIHQYIGRNVNKSMSIYERFSKNDYLIYFQGKGCTKRVVNGEDFYYNSYLKFIQYYANEAVVP